MTSIDDLIEVRLKKLHELKNLGVNPYPGSVSRHETIAEARQLTGKKVAIAGRVRALRGHGKIVFADLADQTGKVQAVFKADALAPEALKLLELIDIGDFLAVNGEVGKTQAGEVSVFVKSFEMIAKALRPLPETWYGFKDIEERYRQRYVDLLVNDEVRQVFITRSKIVAFLRKFLDAQGFLEVETPVLQPIYGGASAKPFVTHHHTLGIDLFLRISDELYLKRLIVGGFEKVYEFGHDFRNEGMDRGHNPEFTMLEFYWAYADYERLMEFTEEMVSALISQVHGSLKLTYQGIQLDFKTPWRRITYREAIKTHANIDIDEADTEEKLKAAIKKQQIEFDTAGVVGYGALLDTLYKHTTRPHLSGPLFLTQRPTAFVSLAKRLPISW